eukprot:6488962-Amphidinium_carterae.2
MHEKHAITCKNNHIRENPEKHRHITMMEALDDCDGAALLEQGESCIGNSTQTVLQLLKQVQRLQWNDCKLYPTQRAQSARCGAWKFCIQAAIKGHVLYPKNLATQLRAHSAQVRENQWCAAMLHRCPTSDQQRMPDT